MNDDLPQARARFHLLNHLQPRLHAEYDRATSFADSCAHYGETALDDATGDYSSALRSLITQYSDEIRALCAKYGPQL